MCWGLGKVIVVVRGIASAAVTFLRFLTTDDTDWDTYDVFYDHDA